MPASLALCQRHVHCLGRKFWTDNLLGLLLGYFPLFNKRIAMIMYFVLIRSVTRMQSSACTCAFTYSSVCVVDADRGWLMREHLCDFTTPILGPLARAFCSFIVSNLPVSYKSVPRWYQQITLPWGSVSKRKTTRQAPLSLGVNSYF